MSITERFRVASLVLGMLVVIAGCAGSRPATGPRYDAAAVRAAGGQAMASLLRDCRVAACGFPVDRSADIDSVGWDGTRLTVFMNRSFAQVPFREDGIEALMTSLRSRMDPGMGVQDLDVRALGRSIVELVPNAFRDRIPRDSAREPRFAAAPRPIVRTVRGVPTPDRGLFGRHIAIWPSHGWYYEHRLGRWEWQRPRLFQTVEDILPASFVLPYLAPMLERAGATVWLARERDVQPLMAVVDNDGSTPGSVYRESGAWERGVHPGFGYGRPPYRDHENPFAMGTSRHIATGPEGSAHATWEPEIPADGDYAVQVSWAAHERATDAAVYEVRHAGGTSRFLVDQRMAAGTWVYVGTFRFRRGAGPDSASVRLVNEGPEGTVVTADAVRFGGGTGLVERGGRTSRRPRWVEAARYHFQFAGMPDTLVYHVTGTDDDYVDDYRGRAEWVNYLRGAPNGPNKDRNAAGLGVPVDLSLAFHTDAGVTRGDSTIGTLLIYSSEGAHSDRTFPDEVSRFASRDLADLIQTQVVGDIRALHDPAWSRRGLWDRDYSEAVRPNVPSALLELLSHQNFADMRQGLDPRFRFTASRAVYKAILRFVAGRNGEPDPIVQPLAPTHVEARWVGDGKAVVRWRAALDPLEPTAVPGGYVVYTRRAGGGFDDGRYVTGDSAYVEVPDGVEWSIRVAAVNAGGESAPSETVSVAHVPGAPRLLVVSAFDRLSAPASIDLGVFRGFLDEVDHGVAEGLELSFAGAQKEFDADVPWRDDDDPGHGASYGDHETTLHPGNTLDFASVHARSALRAGWSVDTVSDERMEEVGAGARYEAVDVLLGEERQTTPGGPVRPEYAAFSTVLAERLVEYARSGGSLLVSGSYVGSELERFVPTDADTSASGPTGPDVRAVLARDVLHLALRAERAVRNGAVRPVGLFSTEAPFSFTASLDPATYAAEAPEAIDPVGDGASTVLRYSESNMSAGVAFKGRHRAVTLGFPLETIAAEAERDRVFAALLAFLYPDPAP